VDSDVVHAIRILFEAIIATPVNLVELRVEAVVIVNPVLGTLRGTEGLTEVSVHHDNDVGVEGLERFLHLGELLNLVVLSNLARRFAFVVAPSLDHLFWPVIEVLEVKSVLPSSHEQAP